MNPLPELATSPSPTIPSRTETHPRTWALRVLGAVVVSAIGLLSVGRALGPGLEALARSEADPIEVLTGRSDLVLGGGVDLFGTLWTFDHAVGRLTDPLPLAAPAAMFEPLGFDVAQAQGMAWMDAWLAAPLVWSLGVPGFYTPHVLITVALTWLAALALLRATGAPWLWAGVLAHGVVANPFVVKELAEGRPTQVHLYLHLLFLLMLLLTERRRISWWLGGVLGGLLLAGSCLVYWFSGVAVGLLGALWLGATVLRDRRRDLLQAGLLIAAVSVVAVAALTWPILGSMVGAAWGAEAVALGPFTLNSATPLLRPASSVELGRIVLDAGLGLPLVVAGMAALTLGPSRRRAVPWLLAATLTATMLWGPVVQWGGLLFPTLSGLVQLAWPPLARCFQLERLVVGPLIGLSLAAALFAAAVAARLPAGLPRHAWSILALAWLLIPLPQPGITGALPLSQPIRAPWFFERLAQDDRGGIIDVPIAASQQDFVGQVVHRKALLGGMGILGPNTRPAGHLAVVDDNSFLRAVLDAVEGRPSEPFEAEDLQALHAMGMGVVVVHGEVSKRPEDLQDLLGEPLFRGSRRAAYALPVP